MILDNVEVYNCSQIDTFKAAIRFDSAVVLHSSITNSTFHNGWGWGGSIVNSKNVIMKDNIWFNFRAIGVAIDRAHNVIFDNNVIAHVRDRETLTISDGYVDKRAGLTVCQYHLRSACNDITVTNNIAAGVTYAGFIAQGHDCGEVSSNSFKDNVAHSIGGAGGGHGALIYPDPVMPNSGTCFKGSFFTAYKCFMPGAYSFFSSKSVVYSNMIMIDNKEGFGPSLTVAGAPEYGDVSIEVNDCKVYGESPIPDCPDDGSFCDDYDKFGFYM